MKWILAILLLISVSANAQTPRPDDSTKYIWYINQYGLRQPRIASDSFFLPPYGDTTGRRPYRNGALMMYNGDGKYYKWNNGTGWNLASGSTGATLSNAGSGYRLVKTAAGQIKTLFGGYGILPDSSSNTDALTFKADTSSTNHLVTQSDLNDAVGTVLLRDTNIVIALNQYPLKHYPVRATLTDTCYFFGDSYAAGTGATTGYDWVSLFCYKMGCVKKNMAVAGTTLEKRSPIDYMASPNMVDDTVNIPLKTFRGKLLFFAFGLNDMGQTAPAYNVTNFKADYDLVMTAAINKGWQPWEIIIISPYWIGYAGYVTYAGITGNAAPTVQRHTDFVGACKETATKWGVGFIDMFHAQLRNDTTLINPDNIHTPDDGHKFIEFTVSKYVGAEENISVGTKTPAAVSNPMAVNLGGKYGTSDDATQVKEAWYFDGTPANTFGVAVSSGKLTFFGGGSSTDIQWKINNGSPLLTLKSAGNLVLDQNISSGPASATPKYFSLGGTYSNVRGDSMGLKFRNYDDGSAKAGINLTTDGSNFFQEYQVPWNVYHDFRIGPSSRMMIVPNGNVLVGTTTDNGYKLQVNGAISTVTDSSSSNINQAWIDSDGKIRKTNIKNFFTSDLNATGNRTHNFKGFNLTIDSLKDTYLSARGDWFGNHQTSQIRFLPTNGSAPLHISTSSLASSGLVDSGAASIDMGAFAGLTITHSGNTGNASTIYMIRGNKSLISIQSDSLQIGAQVKTSSSDSLYVVGAYDAGTKTNSVQKEALTDIGLTKVLKGTTTWDPPSVSANSSTTTTITVTGAALGDPVTISKVSGSYSNGEVYFAYVSATNTVTIQLQNASGGSFNITSDDYHVVVLKY